MRAGWGTLCVALAIGSLQPIVASGRAAAAPPVRPSDVDEHHCSDHVCVHWTEIGLNAAPQRDAKGLPIPDWVETVSRIFERSWSHEVDVLGFLAPVPDSVSFDPGPNDKLDVYIQDIGERKRDGFCRVDDQRDPRQNPPSTYEGLDRAMYCVIDNNFFPKEVGISRLALLKVTASHELFHAVQCAYDCFEDPWLVEGSAVWMEDEVFDGANLNRRYLDKSPLRMPSVPVDEGREGFQYGAWTFWRFLTEHDWAGPDVILWIWEYAASPEIDSMTATRAAIRAQVVPDHAFRDFAVANLRPGVFYEEGRAYPRPSIWRARIGKRQTFDTDITLDHLTSAYFRFAPRDNVAPDDRLVLRVERPESDQQTATVLLRMGRRVRTIHMDEERVVVPLAEARSVRLVVNNGSTRMDCAWETTYACGGYPLDDDVTFSIRARVSG